MAQIGMEFENRKVIEQDCKNRNVRKLAMLLEPYKKKSPLAWNDALMAHLVYLNYLLFILTLACKEFEERIGHLKSPRGEKTEAVLAAIGRQISTFRVADLQAECPGVGLDLIRRILGRLQKEKKIKALGTGRGAKWEKLEN